MRAARTVECSSCGARWAAATARFCGWCGVPLRRPTAPDAARGPRSRQRALAIAGVAVVSVAAVVAAAIGLGSLELPRDRPDPLVELAEEAVVPQGEPLSAQQRAEALAPFDPDRLRCEPEGCERWRIELASNSPGTVHVVPFGEVVVAMADDAMRAYDMESGHERWQAAWPVDEGGRGPSSWTTAQPTPDGELLVVARPDRGALLALDPSGEVVWHERAGGPWHNFAVIGEMVLLAAVADTSIPLDEETRAEYHPENVEAFDARTGERLWRAERVGMMSWSDRALVVRDGLDIVMLDLRSGVEVARREAAPGAWLHHAGEFAVLYEEEGAAQLLDGDDLGVIAELDDFTDITPLAAESMVVAVRHAAVLSHEEGGEQADRVALLEADGSVRWEVPAKARSGSVQLCCPQPRIDGDALVLTAPAGADDELRFSLADGAPVAAENQPPGPVPGGDNVWWMTPETALEQRPGGVRLFHAGEQLLVHGEGAWPVTTEPPFLFTDGRSLLSLQAVPNG